MQRKHQTPEEPASTYVPGLLPAEIYQVAYRSVLSPPTVYRYLRGESLRRSGQARLEAVLHEMGRDDLIRKGSP